MMPVGKIVHLIVEPAMVREQRRARRSPERPIGLRGRIRGDQALGERSVEFRAGRRRESPRQLPRSGRRCWSGCLREQPTPSRTRQNGFLYGHRDAERSAEGDSSVLRVPPDGVTIEVDSGRAYENPVDVVEPSTHYSLPSVTEVEGMAELMENGA